jgi:hypothetical protein
MPRKLSKRSKAPSKPSVALPSAQNAGDPQISLSKHGKLLPSIVYSRAMDPILGEQAAQDAMAYANDAITRMAPRDAAEEMLIAQMLLAHSRTMRLTTLANRGSDIEKIRVLNEYADRASNTYRRLMLALTEYRYPLRAGDTFTVVKQANIAGQQVIHNHEQSSKIATNEQGCQPGRNNASRTAESAAHLPTDASGIGGPAFVRPESSTLEAIHRTPDARRQGSIAPERDEAR